MTLLRHQNRSRGAGDAGWAVKRTHGHAEAQGAKAQGAARPDELSFGAILLPDNQTRFRLWAPAQEEVSVAMASGQRLAMQRSPGGWFETTAPCPAGTRYHFRLSDGMLVPDPASRFQPDDVQGASAVVNPRAYTWRNTAWRGRPWHETVLYELHAGLLGGFAGVTRELRRLRDLGVTAVELMPVNDFPGRRNWGYDGVLPYAPDSAYGTPEELKALIDQAHGLGLMMFLDVVYNHFGPEGNYLHAYAPQFFREDHKTPWGPAIDFSRPEVRAFFTRNVLMWLMEYRFDGLRFDAVHAIGDQSWVDEMAAIVRAAVEPGRHMHLVLEHHNDASHLEFGVDAQWNDDGHNVLHVLLTGENGGYYADYADRPADALARVMSDGWVYQGQHSSYLGAPRGSPCTHLPPTAHVLFLQNHDQVGNRAFGERLTVLTDPAALEAAIALLLLSPQVPLLFMGEETASRSPFLFFTDYHAELADAVREGRRNEFARFADFADPEKRERIPDPNAVSTFEASRPLPDPERGPEREALYRKLLMLRMQEIAPRLESARSAGARAIGPKAVVAQWNLSGNAGEASYTLATNLGSAPVAFTPPPAGLLFTTTPLPPGVLPAHTTAAFLDLRHE
ncbi:MAG TPA: malto-oligosyltrehalose trehalohydrolase [Acetobacteraceae bacterium]|nr:malto-oligosyltrehalose trehalohydrolase [Acetobacteraceae bacterium]